MAHFFGPSRVSLLSASSAAHIKTMLYSGSNCIVAGGSSEDWLCCNAGNGWHVFIIFRAFRHSSTICTGCRRPGLHFKILRYYKRYKRKSQSSLCLHIYVCMCIHTYMYNTHIYFCIYNKKETSEELIPEVFDFLYGAEIGIQSGVNRGPKRESVRPYLWVSIYKPDLALLVFYPFGFIIIRLS